MTYNEKVLCPICSNASQQIKSIKSEFTQNKLSEHFDKLIDKDLEIIDYIMMQCSECSFEFVYPKIGGSSSFYNWVTSQPSYYIASRWEYSKVIELIKGNNIKLLDVGCGDAQFFDQIALLKNQNIDFYGIDTTTDSVKKCTDKGYKVVCMDVQKFKSINKDSLFNVIVSFHCLEHVAKPKEFLEELLSIMDPLGAIYISTPYSPMDFELEWHDVLNNPPHHTGRYNLKSYYKIAEILGLKLEVFMPTPPRILNSAIQSFMYSIYGNTYNILNLKY